MIKHFSIGEPVRPFGSHDWEGHIIAIYEAPEGVHYAVQRPFGKIHHYAAHQIAHRREENPILIMVKGGKYNAQSERQRARG
jgi:hypothetical protein